MFEGIDHVGVRVADLGRAVAFYERLGFTNAYADDRGATLIAGNAKLFLFANRPATPPAAAIRNGPLEHPARIDHITLLVADVDRVYADLRAHGVAFAGEPADQECGARSVGLTDTDGNNLYFVPWVGTG